MEISTTNSLIDQLKDLLSHPVFKLKTVDQLEALLVKMLRKADVLPRVDRPVDLVHLTRLNEFDKALKKEGVFEPDVHQKIFMSVMAMAVESFEQSNDAEAQSSSQNGTLSTTEVKSGGATSDGESRPSKRAKRVSLPPEETTPQAKQAARRKTRSSLKAQEAEKEGREEESQNSSDEKTPKSSSKKSTPTPTSTNSSKKQQAKRGSSLLTSTTKENNLFDDMEISNSHEENKIESLLMVESVVKVEEHNDSDGGSGGAKTPNLRRSARQKELKLKHETTPKSSEKTSQNMSTPSGSSLKSETDENENETIITSSARKSKVGSTRRWSSTGSSKSEKSRRKSSSDEKGSASPYSSSQNESEIESEHEEEEERSDEESGEPKTPKPKKLKMPSVLPINPLCLYILQKEDKKMTLDEVLEVLRQHPRTCTINREQVKQCFRNAFRRPHNVFGRDLTFPTKYWALPDVKQQSADIDEIMDKAIAGRMTRNGKPGGGVEVKSEDIENEQSPEIKPESSKRKRRSSSSSAAASNTNTTTEQGGSATSQEEPVAALLTLSGSPGDQTPKVPQHRLSIDQMGSETV